MKLRAQEVKTKHLPDQWTANDILKVIAVGWRGCTVSRRMKDTVQVSQIKKINMQEKPSPHCPWIPKHHTIFKNRDTVMTFIKCKTKVKIK